MSGLFTGMKAGLRGSTMLVSQRSGGQHQLSPHSAHLVTSAVFLPKLVLKDEPSSLYGSGPPGLSFTSSLLLLLMYLAVFAPWYYIMRGDHVLQARGCVSSTLRLVSRRSTRRISRACSWTSLRAGYLPREGTAAQAPAFESIERLDGTLFVRVAGLTFDRVGWVDEGEKAEPWDLDGIQIMGLSCRSKGAA